MSRMLFFAVMLLSFICPAAENTMEFRVRQNFPGKVNNVFEAANDGSGGGKQSVASAAYRKINLEPEIKSITMIYPHRNLWEGKAENEPADMRELLLPGMRKEELAKKYYTASFFRAKEGEKTVILEIEFNRPVKLASFRLTGRNLNQYYSMKEPGTEPALRLNSDGKGKEWILEGSAGEQDSPIEKLKITLNTDYKINLDTLEVSGWKQKSPTVPGTRDLTVIARSNRRQNLEPEIKSVVMLYPYHNLWQGKAENEIADMRELLLPGMKKEESAGKPYCADFFRGKDGEKTVIVAVEFRKPVNISSFTLTGRNLNNQFTMKDPDAEPRFQLFSSMAGNRWTLDGFAIPGTPAVSRLEITLNTDGKINIDSLQVFGANENSDQEKISCCWVDGSGEKLTEPMEAEEGVFELDLPSHSPGYYGLRLKSESDRRELLFPKEYGFSVLPAEFGTVKRQPASNPFGMVHMNLNDPYTGISRIKTMSVSSCFNYETGKLDAAAFQKMIATRRASGFEEMMLVGGKDWRRDGETPFSEKELARLVDHMNQEFRAVPDLLNWELGLEENLAWRKNDGKWPYYWQNLEQKSAAVRKAAGAVNPRIALAYQIAELPLNCIETFAASPAARNFDLLSLHPYAWSTFQMPDLWLDNYLKSVRDILKKHSANLQIDFSEVGCPQEGNPIPGGFFGYRRTDLGAGNDAHVKGVTRAGYPVFLVKMNVLALANDIKYVYWYNYRDHGDKPEYPEHHFGLVDHWGFPKPAYQAYCVMANLIDDAKFSGRSTIGSVSRFVFDGNRRQCIVVWNQAGKKDAVALSTLAPGAKTVRGFDLFGREIPADGPVTVSERPLYLICSK